MKTLLKYSPSIVSLLAIVAGFLTPSIQQLASQHPQYSIAIMGLWSVLLHHLQSPNAPTNNTIAKMLILVCMFAIAAPAHAQNIGEGSVVFAVNLPGPGTERVYEFSICCGAPGAPQWLGNGFGYQGYVGGTFGMSFLSKRGGPCSTGAGCNFSGTWTKYTEQPVDLFCYNVVGTVTGTFGFGSKVIDNVSAEFTQPHCTDEWLWDATGGFNVHFHAQ